jgi:hypothetical protein
MTRLIDAGETYRQQLRATIRKDKFERMHYSPEQIANARAMKRRQLESDIAESKDALKLMKPNSGGVMGVVKRIPIIGKFI